MATILSRWTGYLIAALLVIAPTAAPGDTNLDALVAGIAPEAPLEVAVGVEITQITGVDQRAENFGVVARIRMRWQDPDLAFDEATEGTRLKSMKSDDFNVLARRMGINLPAFTIENQQSRSFEKASVVNWFADGTAIFLQEVILTLQAPDFDFVQFPFDSQKFYFRIIANGPVSFVRLVPLQGASGLGDTLGEEEWVVASDWTEVDEVTGLSGLTSSRFSLGFEAHRHLLYYWARIFVPVILLTLIGWANLFLEEYRRRIDIATGNLLALIAYNFTISGDLPRLGYLTFLDALMMAIFIISVGSVVYNVALRRLSMTGLEARARAIDWHVTWWGYPALFVLTIGILRQVFFAESVFIHLR
ncbi:hypothetical protein [Tropicimonas sp. IMCC6043]|uniref:hypothetical protein n=1 Tax=Tropicimonas sp. IMCC6043 TaxID=2510645 RepID=UPI0013E9D084|nr:hypothetical protein [Tropicimonas sp. IMCC6043]